MSKTVRGIPPLLAAAATDPCPNAAASAGGGGGGGALPGRCVGVGGVAALDQCVCFLFPTFFQSSCVRQPLSVSAATAAD